LGLGDGGRGAARPRPFFHAAYISPDIVGYARKMERSALEACYLVMRVPRHDGVIGELSRRIHGTFHDSPNFIVRYNALLQAGIAGHVILKSGASMA